MNSEPLTRQVYISKQAAKMLEIVAAHKNRLESDIATTKTTPHSLADEIIIMAISKTYPDLYKKVDDWDKEQKERWQQIKKEVEGMKV